MKKVPIGEATIDELRGFAIHNLGLDVPSTANTKTVIAKIRSAWDKDHIVVLPAESPDPQVGDAPIPVGEDSAPPKEGYVRVHINITEEAGGADPVPVSVNGKAMLVPRAEDVDIPESYFHVLQNAITHKYEPLEGGGMNPIPRKVPLYPMQRVA